MVGLFNTIKGQQETGFSDISATDYANAVASGDFDAADKLFDAAKRASDGYVAPTQKPQKHKNDITDQMYIMKGAVASEFTREEGGAGTVVFNKSSYRCATEKDCSSDEKLKHSTELANLREGNCFYYDGGIYALQDGGIVRLRALRGDYWNLSAWGKGLYGDLIRDTKAYFGIYHGGGFVGDFSKLSSNEEFAKLLKGEYVSTPQQMDNFMRNTLPMLRSSGSSQNIFNSLLITIQTGNVTKDSLPELKGIVDKAVKRVKAEMENALSRTSRTI